MPFTFGGLIVRFGLVLLMSAVLSRGAFASECTAYPKGDWNFTEASALQFEQKWLDILTSKDTAALDCMLAPEFKDTSRKGALRSKEQVLRELSSRREQDQYQQKLARTQASLFGDTAVIHGVNVISDSQGHQLLRIRFTDVLRFEKEHWVAIAAQETDEQQQSSTHTGS